MRQIALHTFHSAYAGSGLVCLVLVLCVCVVTQMLGMPVTLLGLLDSPDTLMESVSEDPSILPSLPRPVRPSLLHLLSEFRHILQLPILLTSVFRPPAI
jgi:hypothetical protein